MVPSALQFHTEAFADEYGEAPDPDAATQTLEDAGVDTPVPLEVWWTPSHYGPSSGDEYAEIKRQLDESGLFDVTLKSTEWNQYSEAAFTDKYPVYQLGWFPDYPDADNYTSPSTRRTASSTSTTRTRRWRSCSPRRRRSTDDATREEAFAQIQQIGAEDAPTIPYIELIQVAVTRDGVEGVADTLDPSYIFRYWVIIARTRANAEYAGRGGEPPRPVHACSKEMVLSRGRDIAAGLRADAARARDPDGPDPADASSSC